VVELWGCGGWGLLCGGRGGLWAVWEVEGWVLWWFRWWDMGWSELTAIEMGKGVLWEFWGCGGSRRAGGGCWDGNRVEDSKEWLSLVVVEFVVAGGGQI